MYAWHTPEWLPTDEDTVRLLDESVIALEDVSGKSFTEASALVREYYLKFTNAEFCAGLDIPVQDDDFLFHEAAGGVALRVHYYLVLRADPSPRAFIEWRSQLSRGRAA